MEGILVLAVMFVLLWLLFVLPQQRRARAHQAMVQSVAVGDEVILTAGIYGRVVGSEADDLMVEVSPGVELRVARGAVLRRIETGADLDEGLTASPGAADDPSLAAGDGDGREEEL